VDCGGILGYELIDHTADVGIDLIAETPEALFCEALRGMADCLTDVELVEPLESRRMELEGATLELLLVDWLSEALYVFETDGLVLCQAELEIQSHPDSTQRLKARTVGELFDPQKHPLRMPIKGVTYHGLYVQQDGDSWRARVIFDV
jgi:SHS2 domain-containing protein